MNILIFVLLLAAVAVPSFLAQKKTRQRIQTIEEIQRNLALGEEVVTTAGIHAVVRGITEEIVELEISSGVVVRFDKSAIVRNVSAEQHNTGEVSSSDSDSE